MKPVIAIEGISLKKHPGHCLELRRWTKEDAPAIFKEVDKNRDHLAKWLPWVQTTHSVEDSVQFVNERITGFENKDRFEYGIFLKPNDSDKELSLIGAVGLVSLVSQEFAEIGYWLAKDMQGNGIITMAVKALIEEAKESSTFSKFVIKSVPDNMKSRKVPERLGFIEKGLSKSEMLLNGVSHKLIEYHFM